MCWRRLFKSQIEKVFRRLDNLKFEAIIVWSFLRKFLSFSLFYLNNEDCKEFKHWCIQIICLPLHIIQVFKQRNLRLYLQRSEAEGWFGLIELYHRNLDCTTARILDTETQHFNVGISGMLPKAFRLQRLWTVLSRYWNRLLVPLAVFPAFKKSQPAQSMPSYDEH